MEKPNADTEMPEADLREIARKSIDTILQEGIDFNVVVDRLNILHKIGFKRKIRKFMIYPLHLGSLERISKIIFDMEFHGFDVISKKPDEIKDLEFLRVGIENMAAKQNINNIVKMAAIAIIDRDPTCHNPLIRHCIKFKEKHLANFLKENLKPSSAYQLYAAVIQNMDVNSFLGLTVSIPRMSLIETKNFQTNGGLSEASSRTSEDQSPGMKSFGNEAGQTS